ncbi:MULTISPECIES: hypothetical protein [Ponticoccus]|uniref:AraC family transcriptional regulator n=1 Tax=Ponticoccus litoralis TaxID=422297 RepID=A0AAW9SGD2_9RHOB
MSDDAATADRVTALVEAELAAFDGTTRAGRMLLEDFARLRVAPRPVSVRFSGGFVQRCWTVTRSNGAYSVVYMPRAGYFSLCVDTDLGPVDIAVHGPALAVFGAV